MGNMLTRKLIFIILQMKTVYIHTERKCVISDLLCKQKVLPKLLNKPIQYIVIRINIIPGLKNGVNRKIKRLKK